MTPDFTELVFVMCGIGPLKFKIGELLDDNTSNIPLGIFKLRAKLTHLGPVLFFVCVVKKGT